MHAQLNARKPAPVLAWRPMGLRRCSRPNAFGNALGSSLASLSSGVQAASSADPLGDFIDRNMPAWERRQARFDQVTEAFRQPRSPERSQDLQNYLERAVTLSVPGAQRVTIEGVDVGAIIGRGYDRITVTPGGVGPLLYFNNLNKVTGVYQLDATSGTWKTVSIYPVKR